MDATEPLRYKICPSCAEKVREPAARCRFCGHSFALQSASESSALHISISSAEMLDCLEVLAERSLLIFDVDSGRFRMLESVRDYARERSEQSDIRQARHALYFAEQAEQQKVRIQTADAEPALLTLTVEEANARTALEWASGDEEGVMTGMRLCVALALFWHVRGQFREARLRCAAAIESARRWQGRADPSLLAATYAAAGNLAAASGDAQGARGLLGVSLRMRESQGNEDELASALHNLAITEYALSNYDVARGLEDRALALNRGLGHMGRIASNLNSLGMISAQRGDEEQALAYYLETLEIAHAMGDRWTTMVVLYNLSELFERARDISRARLRLASCFDYCRDLEAWSIVCPAFDLLARLEFREGRLSDGAYALGVSESIRRSMHIPRSSSEAEPLTEIQASIAMAPGEVRAELERGKSADPREALQTAATVVRRGVKKDDEPASQKL